MNNKYRNIFLIFGIAAIVIMLLTFHLDYGDLVSNLVKAGMWLPAIIGLWVFIYLLNAWSWYLIIRDGKSTTPISFLKVYKLTITGFALNYATPCGLMGGEPYRIMELTPYVGASKATSSVILYVMMHIFSHFCFWLFGCGLYIVLWKPTGVGIWTLLGIIGLICFTAIYFFMKGYKNGMAMKSIRLLQHIPFLKNWATRFYDRQHETLARIDSQIAELHKQRRVTFYGSLSLEFGARILGCVEVLFILNILTTNVSFSTCILIMAFTSLFSNALFFSPMQLGSREGGFALAVSGLHIPSAFGVYTGLIARIRELFWMCIGIILMKVGNKVKIRSEHPLKKFRDVKGIIFDYGGTIDTNSRHWASVLWEYYRKCQVPCGYEEFREAYVHAERALARHPYIQPNHNFHDVLSIKVKLEMDYLNEQHYMDVEPEALSAYVTQVADGCYQYVIDTLTITRPLLEHLAKRYKLVLVSNFYGNIQTILQDFGIQQCFSHIVESSVVGVRKPDPAIYQLGVDSMELPASQVLVIGDSFSKDMVPAHAIGCRTIWLKGEGWGNEAIDESLPDKIITNLKQLI